MKYSLLVCLISALFSGNAQQTINETLTHNGGTRNYTIHIPPTYVSGTDVPLLFCFHGYTSNASNIQFYSNFNAISDTANFIVVYPQGTLLSGSTHWNVGGWTTGSTADDVGFTEAMIDSVSAEYSIDADRIYSTGMSNGGYMSFLLACQLSSKIAAVASVTGSMTPQMFTACNPQHPTPVLQIHGDADGTVPYNGDPSWTKSINDVVDYWVNYNNCVSTPTTNSLPNINTGDGSTVDQSVHNNGDNCSTVEHFKVFGGDHDWPGAWGNMDMNASIEVWRFLSQYDINGEIGCTTNGVEDKADFNYEIYPNPCSDILKIKSNASQANYQILTITGAVVLSGQLSETITEINIEELSNGSYILKTGEFMSKFVKN